MQSNELKRNCFVNRMFKQWEPRLIVKYLDLWVCFVQTNTSVENVWLWPVAIYWIMTEQKNTSLGPLIVRKRLFLRLIAMDKKITDLCQTDQLVQPLITNSCFKTKRIIDWKITDNFVLTVYGFTHQTKISILRYKCLRQDWSFFGLKCLVF